MLGLWIVYRTQAKYFIKNTSKNAFIIIINPFKLPYIFLMHFIRQYLDLSIDNNWLKIKDLLAEVS